MEKPIAAFLQAGAAVMFFAAGAAGHDAMLLLLPAAVSGVAGLLLWNRTPTQRLPAPPVSAPAPLASPAAGPDRTIGQMQEMLTSLQQEVADLREDRDFVRELYSGSHTREK